MGAVLGLFAGKKKAAAAAPTASASPTGPIIKPLGASDPLRKMKGKSSGPIQGRMATILSDKLGA